MLKKTDMSEKDAEKLREGIAAGNYTDNTLWSKLRDYCFSDEQTDELFGVMKKQYMPKDPKPKAPASKAAKPAKPAKQKASNNKSVAALGGTDEEWKNSGMSKQEYANSHVAKNKAEVGGDIYSYLKNNKNDSIIVRTTYAGGGWHDVEFDAHLAGFDIYRVNSPDMASRREFSECYLFKREKK